MELSGGEVAAKRACSTTVGDRISALPDELLLIILLFLSNAADAARTSVLSRRWRAVWTLLPDLRVPFFPEPLSFRRALTASQLPLHYLRLEGDRAIAESLAIWLPAAARRLSGTLFFLNHAPDPKDMPAFSRLNKWTSNRTRGGFFEMPCFENAAEIILNLGFLRVQMPSDGVFVQLTVLVLERVWFCRPCNLGAAVSSPRCPRLQVLRVCNTRGLFSLDINSESLLELELNNIVALYSLSIEAAVLKKLTVMNCFCRIDKNFATISAPQLVFLSWGNPLGQQKFLSLGQMPHLQSIGEFSYLVYTDQSSKIVYTDQGPVGIPDNSAFMELLQRFKFKAIESLALALIYTSDLENCQYMMEDMKVFPDPAILYLSVLAHGHSFGASLFHVFRMCLGIKRLVLVLLDNAVNSEAQTDDPCPPDCVCDEQNNWKTEELLLINLQEIEIQLLGGFEHEVSFVKRLLNWATALNKVTVTLSSSTTENDAKELFQMFKSLSKPEVCIKLMYHNHKEVLYAT